MQQHAVPQNITGFQFKLVGFLTLKQFIFLAAAGLLSFSFFTTTSGLFRYSAIAICWVIASGFAFISINGHSFDKWIVLLINALVSPSRRIWKKENKTIPYFGPEFSSYFKRSLQRKTPEKSGKEKLSLLLTQIKAREGDHLDIVETKLGRIDLRSVVSSEGGQSG